MMERRNWLLFFVCLVVWVLDVFLLWVTTLLMLWRWVFEYFYWGSTYFNLNVLLFYDCFTFELCKLALSDSNAFCCFIYFTIRNLLTDSYARSQGITIRKHFGLFQANVSKGRCWFILRRCCTTFEPCCSRTRNHLYVFWNHSRKSWRIQHLPQEVSWFVKRWFFCNWITCYKHSRDVIKFCYGLIEKSLTLHSLREYRVFQTKRSL